MPATSSNSPQAPFPPSSMPLSSGSPSLAPPSQAGLGSGSPIPVSGLDQPWLYSTDNHSALVAMHMQQLLAAQHQQNSPHARVPSQLPSQPPFAPHQLPPHLFQQALLHSPNPASSGSGFIPPGYVPNPLFPPGQTPFFTSSLQRANSSPAPRAGGPGPFPPPGSSPNWPGPRPGPAGASVPPSASGGRSPALDFSDFMTTSDDESHRPDQEHTSMQLAANHPASSSAQNASPQHSVPVPDASMSVSSPAQTGIPSAGPGPGPAQGPNGSNGTPAAAGSAIAPSSSLPPSGVPVSAAPGHAEGMSQPNGSGQVPALLQQTQSQSQPHERGRMANLFSVVSATPQGSPSPANNQFVQLQQQPQQRQQQAGQQVSPMPQFPYPVNPYLWEQQRAWMMRQQMNGNLPPPQQLQQPQQALNGDTRNLLRHSVPSAPNATAPNASSPAIPRFPPLPVPIPGPMPLPPMPGPGPAPGSGIRPSPDDGSRTRDSSASPPEDNMPRVLCRSLDSLRLYNVQDDQTRGKILESISNSQPGSLDRLARYEGLLRHFFLWLSDLRPSGGKSESELYPTVSRLLPALLARMVRLVVHDSKMPEWLKKDLTDLKLLVKRMRRTLNRAFSAELGKLLEAWASPAPGSPSDPTTSTSGPGSGSARLTSSASSSPAPGPSAPPPRSSTSANPSPPPSANGKRTRPASPPPNPTESAAKKPKKIADSNSVRSGSENGSSVSSHSTVASNRLPAAPASKAPPLTKLPPVPKSAIKPGAAKPAVKAKSVSGSQFTSAKAALARTAAESNAPFRIQGTKRSVSPPDANAKRRTLTGSKVDEPVTTPSDLGKRESSAVPKPGQRPQRDARTGIDPKAASSKQVGVGAVKGGPNRAALGTKSANGKVRPPTLASILGEASRSTNGRSESPKPALPSFNKTKADLPSFRKVSGGPAGPAQAKPAAKKSVGLIDKLLQHTKESATPGSSQAGRGSGAGASSSKAASSNPRDSADQSDPERPKPIGRKGGMKRSISSPSQPKFSGRVAFAGGDQLATYQNLPPRDSVHWHPWWVAADWGAGYEERARDELAKDPFSDSLSGGGSGSQGGGKDQFISSFLSGKDADGHPLLHRDSRSDDPNREEEEQSGQLGAQEVGQDAVQEGSQEGTQEASTQDAAAASDEQSEEYDPLSSEHELESAVPASALPQDSAAVGEQPPETSPPQSQQQPRVPLLSWYTPPIMEDIPPRGEQSQLAGLDANAPWADGSAANRASDDDAPYQPLGLNQD